jgi:Uma2 family endonuclease
MSVIASSAPFAPGPSSLLLHGVSWLFYETILNELQTTGQRLYLTYDCGELEIMAPLEIHERAKKLIGALIEDTCVELGMSMEMFGSTTFRREELEKGLEPDECYYIQNAAAVRGRRKLDFTKDPPPGLAVEVDVTSRSLPRMPIYAALGVPELWRQSASGLQFLTLNRPNEYIPSARSIAFPFLAPADLERFLKMLYLLDSSKIRREFRQWVREAASNQ